MNGGSWVIDASVLAKVYLRDEEFSALAAGIVSRYVEGDLELIAPLIIAFEIPNAIQAAVRRRRLNPDDGRQAIADFFALHLPSLGDASTIEPMVAGAYGLAERVGCRLYDVCYLIVAEQSGFPLVTADLRLYEQVKSLLPYVRWIGDLPLEAGITA